MINNNNNDVGDNLTKSLNAQQLKLINQLSKGLLEKQSKFKETESVMEWNSQLEHKYQIQKVVIKEFTDWLGNANDHIFDLQA